MQEKKRTACPRLSAAAILAILPTVALWPGSQSGTLASSSHEISEGLSVTPSGQEEAGTSNRNQGSAVADSVLFMTYIGGSEEQIGTGSVFDSEGNLLLGGTTFSDDFPVVNAFQPELAGSGDAFVAKIDPTTGKYLFSTFIGGTGADAGAGLFVDKDDNIYVCGTTRSSDFPLLNPIQDQNNGGRDVLLVKLSSDGQLVQSTYLGGAGDDRCSEVVVRNDGSIVLGGYTTSGDYPTSNPIQPTNAGEEDVFVTVLTAAGDQILFSTYLGGSQREWLRGLAVDDDGNVFVAGETRSPNFPTQSAILSNLQGEREAFVAKVLADGSDLHYSTYLGGSSDSDSGFDVAVDDQGNAHVVGVTASSDFPTADAVQPEFGGGLDGFITKLDPDGAIIYSTFIGGPDTDALRAVDIDDRGNAVSVGATDGFELPTLRKSAGPQTVDDPAVVVVSLPSGQLLAVDRFGDDGFTQWWAVDATDGKVAVTGDRTVGTPSVSTDGSEGSSSSTYDMIAGVLSNPPLSAMADLQVTKFGPTKAVDNVGFAYTITVKNNGPQEAVAVILEDEIPEGMLIDSVRSTKPFCDETDPGLVCSFGTLAVGEEVVVDLYVRGIAVGETLQNWVKVSSDTEDDNFSNSIEYWPTEIVPPGQADVEIQKTIGIAEFDSGDTLQTAVGSTVALSFEVTNNGPDEAINVVVTDALPEGFTATEVSYPCYLHDGALVCRLFNIPPGESKTETVVVRGSEEPGTFGNTASVTNARTDDNSANNEDSATLIANAASAELDVELDLDQSTIRPLGGNLVVSVSNTGSSDANNVELVAGLNVIKREGTSAFPRLTSDDPNCGGEGETCMLGSIGPGETVRISFIIEPFRDEYWSPVESFELSATARASNANPDTDEDSVGEDGTGSSLIEALFLIGRSDGTNASSRTLDVRIDGEKVVEGLEEPGVSEVSEAEVSSPSPSVQVVDPNAVDGDTLVADFKVDLVFGDSLNLSSIEGVTIGLFPTIDGLGHVVVPELRLESSVPNRADVVFLNGCPNVGPVDATLNDTTGQHMVLADLGSAIPYGSAGDFVSVNPNRIVLQLIDPETGEVQDFSLDLNGAAGDVVIATCVESTSAQKAGSSSLGNAELFVMDVDGTVYETPVVTSSQDEEPVVTEFELSQPYPNPYSEKTNLSYSLPEPTHVELYVMDVQGRLVRKLIDQEQAAGSHSVEWRAEDDRGIRLSSGLYLVQLKAGTRRQTRPVVFVAGR